MAKINLRERIGKDLFLLDGAMGTQIFTRGIKPEKGGDYLNIESPDIIFDIHRSYLKAGSDAVITNTLGANKYALARHGLAEEVDKINTAAAEIARRAAGEEKYVLGDIGPSGDFLEPLGSIKPDELKEVFTRQANALLTGGVDGFIIETVTFLDELTIAIEAMKSVCELPVFASMSFDKAGSNFRTMMGVDVDSTVAKSVSLGVDAVGFNCGKMSLDDYVELAESFVLVTKAQKQDVVLLAEPNAGQPELVGDEVVYRVSPVDYAAAMEKIHSAGINIIGGCCGTSPAHIKAVAKKLKKR